MKANRWVQQEIAGPPVFGKKKLIHPVRGKRTGFFFTIFFWRFPHVFKNEKN